MSRVSIWPVKPAVAGKNKIISVFAADAEMRVRTIAGGEYLSVPLEIIELLWSERPIRSLEKMLRRLRERRVFQEEARLPECQERRARGRGISSLQFPTIIS